MFSVSKPSANRLDIELSGVLDAEAMRLALDHFVEKSEGVTNGKILYKIADFEIPTLGAMAVELYRMPTLLGLISKFDKCAVLSDAAWIRTAAEIEGAIFQPLEIKSFRLANIEAAEAWLDGGATTDESEFGDENFPV